APRGAGRDALGGRAPARELRARPGLRSGDPRARRGDELGGLGAGGADRGGDRRAPEGPHVARDRAPALHGPERRPHPRAAPRRAPRAGDPRGAARPGRTLRPPARAAGRAGRVAATSRGPRDLQGPSSVSADGSAESGRIRRGATGCRGGSRRASTVAVSAAAVSAARALSAGATPPPAAESTRALSALSESRSWRDRSSASRAATRTESITAWRRDTGW